MESSDSAALIHLHHPISALLQPDAAGSIQIYTTKKMNHGRSVYNLLTSLLELAMVLGMK